MTHRAVLCKIRRRKAALKLSFVVPAAYGADRRERAAHKRRDERMVVVEKRRPAPGLGAGRVGGSDQVRRHGSCVAHHARAIADSRCQMTDGAGCFLVFLWLFCARPLLFSRSFGPHALSCVLSSDLCVLCVSVVRLLIFSASSLREMFVQQRRGAHW